ncbi:MAG: 30S ribosomal protein S6 [Chloroflexi bacterium]|nr:30S ribosomal protein S6 [Chloroflexota bacterium]
MKRNYELAFVVRVDAPTDEGVNDAVNQVQAWVTAGEMGAVTKVDRWGRRKLAYEINGQREGYYVIMNAEIDTKNLPELERNLKLSNAILRYLLIRADE